jgi:hypothetical protein
MKVLNRPPCSSRSGVALLLSVLVLFVVITISIQIGIGTMTDARVARNDLGLAAMDDAIESAMLEVAEQLKTDADGGEGDADPMGGGMDPAAAMGGGAAGSEEGGGGAVDSKEDEWARPQRTEINGLELRIFVQDEDSKYNVLNMLHSDEELASANQDRVARIIDLCREGTDHDIRLNDAETMAREMLEYMTRRYSSATDEAEFLSEEPMSERRLPLSLREFVRLESFHEGHFRDFRGREGNIVHSLGSFLTVWSCLTDKSSGSNGSQQLDAGMNAALGSGASSDSSNSTSAAATGSKDGSSTLDMGAGAGTGSSAGGDASGAGSSGSGSAASSTGPSNGFGVNLNTAPVAVLKGLFDDRDISMRFWDEVIEYRNLEEETERGEEEPEPIYDEYGEEVIQRQVFDSVEELQEVRSWDNLRLEEQEELRNYLTTTSNVFSVFITARRSTSNSDNLFIASSAAEREREEELAAGLVRTVRAVVWRRDGGDSGTALDVVLRWEVLDYSPYEVKDYPDKVR